MDIMIGTPGQHFSVEVDTSFGTSLIVARQRLLRKDFVFYNIYSSISNEVDRRWVHANFGTHQIEGGKVADVLQVGGLLIWNSLTQIGEYKLIKFHFQLIESIRTRPKFLDAFSGKLGLAPVSQVTTESFAQSLLRLCPDEPVFTIWFRPSQDGVYRSGMFSFGGIHDYRYVGPLIYVPLLPPGNSWTVQASRISVGQDVICHQDCSILFNTSVRHLYGPPEKVTLIHRSVQPSALRDRHCVLKYYDVTQTSCIYFGLKVHRGKYNVQLVRNLLISVGSDVICHQDCSILFNTAIRHLYGPPEKVTLIHRSVQPSAVRDRVGKFTLNCEDEAQYPPLVVQFGGVEFQWRMSDLWK
ncbi:hypothetical protein X801_06624, partial [Opisthorchis viverrini]